MFKCKNEKYFLLKKGVLIPWRKYQDTVEMLYVVIFEVYSRKHCGCLLNRSIHNIDYDGLKQGQMT